MVLKALRNPYTEKMTPSNEMVSAHHWIMEDTILPVCLQSVKLHVTQVFDYLPYHLERDRTFHLITFQTWALYSDHLGVFFSKTFMIKTVFKKKSDIIVSSILPTSQHNHHQQKRVKPFKLWIALYSFSQTTRVGLKVETVLTSVNLTLFH